MSFFSRHIDTLLNGHTIAALALIRTVAAFVIKDCLAHPCLVIFVYPFGVFCSSLAQYFFEPAELFTPQKLGQWLMGTLLASTCGAFMGTGLLAAVAIVRCRPSPRVSAVSMGPSPRHCWKAWACTGLQSG